MQSVARAAAGPNLREPLPHQAPQGQLPSPLQLPCPGASRPSQPPLTRPILLLEQCRTRNHEARASCGMHRRIPLWENSHWFQSLRTAVPWFPGLPVDPARFPGARSQAYLHILKLQENHGEERTGETPLSIHSFDKYLFKPAVVPTPQEKTPARCCPSGAHAQLGRTIKEKRLRRAMPDRPTPDGKKRHKEK